MNHIMSSLCQSFGARLPVSLLVLVVLAAAMLLWATPAQACGPYCDMMGGDKAAYYMDNAAACEATCDNTADCRGWTWVKPGVQGPQAVCYIKNQIMPARRSDCCISGYRGDRSAVNSMRQFRFDVKQKEVLPPAVQGGGPSGPRYLEKCTCVNSRGQPYVPRFGMGFCDENIADYNCQR